MMDDAKMLEKMIEMLEETEEYASKFCVSHDSCEDCLAKKYGTDCMVYLKASFLVNKNILPVLRCCCCSNYTEVEGEKPLCSLHNVVIAPLDFCSYGERRK